MGVNFSLSEFGNVVASAAIVLAGIAAGLKLGWASVSAWFEEHWAKSDITERMTDVEERLETGNERFDTMAASLEEMSGEVKATRVETLGQHQQLNDRIDGLYKALIK